MPGGELTLKDEGRIYSAVSAAEVATGVAFCVAVADSRFSDPAHLADKAFADLGLGGRAEALILVMPDSRRIEMRTSAAAADKLPDHLCTRIVNEIRIPLIRDDVVEGIEAGMAVLTAATEPTTA